MAVSLQSRAQQWLFSFNILQLLSGDSKLTSRVTAAVYWGAGQSLHPRLQSDLSGCFSRIVYFLEKGLRA